MQLNQESQSAKYTVRSYTPGTITVGETAYNHGLIITPTCCDPWQPARASAVQLNDIAQLTSYAPEIIIIGTGASQVFLEMTDLAPLMAARIGFEQMDTAAACRTFTILANEGRNVLAALCPW